jgi:hypothetical protein
MNRDSYFVEQAFRYRQTERCFNHLYSAVAQQIEAWNKSLELQFQPPLNNRYKTELGANGTDQFTLANPSTTLVVRANHPIGWFTVVVRSSYGFETIVKRGAASLTFSEENNNPQLEGIGFLVGCSSLRDLAPFLVESALKTELTEEDCLGGLK